MVRFFAIFLVVSCAACSNKYRVFEDNYRFRSEDGKPKYHDLNYWAAHPWKWDPSDSVPEPLRNDPTMSGKKDSTVDVFFLHPTTFTKKRDKRIPNAPIDDDFINAKTDYSSILYQASVFNHQSRVFAPRYRQAHIYNFFKGDKKSAEAAFDLAYEDIRASFEYYLQNWNRGRPIIIASHSQGSLLAERLLRDYFEGKTLKNKLVAAYIVGWPVPKEYFTALTMCADSLETGCLCSWRTVRRGFVPRYLKKEKGNSFVTNPISWTTDGSYTSRVQNKGSVLKNFNRVYRRTTDAQISNGLLNVRKPRFPWSFLYFTRNYHIADYNLFYINIRENISRRIAMYRKNSLRN